MSINSETGRKRSFRYPGFALPTTTPVPDDVFDVIAPELTEAELRVLLYIIRRTYGFNKERDQISLTQMTDGITTRDGRVLDKGTGMSRRGVMKGCAGLLNKGIIIVKKGKSSLGDSEINVYRLRFQGEVDKVGNGVPYPGERSAPPVGNEVPPQQTVVQETALHINSTSKDIHTASRTSKRVGGVGEEGGNVYAQEQREPRAPRQVGEILATRPLPRHRGRTAKPIPYIEQLLTDWSAELHDEEHTKSNVTQTMRLYKVSRLSEDAFVARLYEARSITKQRGNIAKQVNGGLPGLKNKMPYYFAVLRDLLGLKDSEPGDLPGAGPAAPPG